MKYVLLVCAALVGCASGPSHQQAAQLVNNAPEWELCYVAVSGRGNEALRASVYQEIGRRRTDCNLHMAVVAAKMQADAARSQTQLNTGLMLMQMGRPQPMPPPLGVNCRTYNRGGYLQTVCD